MGFKIMNLTQDSLGVLRHGPSGHSRRAHEGQFEVNAVTAAYASHVVDPKTLEGFVIAGHGVPSSDAVAVYGTDLGFTATLNGTTYVIFGDTWRPDPNGPGVTTRSGFDDPKQSTKNNDSIASFVMGLPGSLPELTFHSFPGTNLYNPIVVFRDAGGTSSVPLGDWATPGGAFATKSHLYISVLDPLKNHSVQLARFLGDDVNGGSTFHAVGAPLSQKRLIQGAVATGINDRTGTAPAGVLGQSSFWELFTNIAFFSGEAPSDPALEALGISSPVFVWGRPSFWATRPYIAPDSPTDPPQFGSYLGPTGLTDMYLMVFDATALDTITDTATPIVHYFYAGTDSNDNAIWDTHSGKAQALLNENPPAEVPAVNQMSVTYDANLGVWLMLYGGRFDTTTLVGGTELSEFLQGYDDVAAGIMFRWAPNPWGPWSPRQRIFNGRPPSGCATVFDNESYTYNPDTCALDLSDTPCSLLKPDMFPGDHPHCRHHLTHPFHVNHFHLTPGFEYGASIWYVEPLGPSPGTAASTVWFAMSTWNPYHVVLMSTTVTRTSTDGVQPLPLA